MSVRELPISADWPPDWRNVPLWVLFDRIKDVGHPDEEMLSVYREHGVIRKSSRDDNTNQTAENRDIYQLVGDGWLIINRMKAWQGSVGVSSLRGIISGHYLCFRPRHGEDPRFLNCLLRSKVYTMEYARMSRGVRPSQIEIDNDELRGLRVALPPIDEQRRIADFLDAVLFEIDSLAQMRRQQLNLLDERYAAAISELLVPGIANGRVRNQLWPWLPAHTPTARLGHLARIQAGVTVDGARGKSPDDAEYPYLRVANVQGEKVDLSEIKKIVISNSIAKRSLLRSGDVLMTEANGNPDNLGRGAVWRGEVANAVHQNHVFAIRVDQRKLLPDFLAALMASVHGRRYFRFTSTQVGIATTSSSKVLDFPVPVLALNEQRVVARRCQEAREATHRAAEVLDRQLTLLAERRQALITAAVTGQIDVTTARGVET